MLMEVNWLDVMLIIVLVIEFMVNLVIFVFTLFVVVANTVIVVYKVRFLD